LPLIPKIVKGNPKFLKKIQRLPYLKKLTENYLESRSRNQEPGTIGETFLSWFPAFNIISF